MPLLHGYGVACNAVATSIRRPAPHPSPETAETLRTALTNHLLRLLRTMANLTAGSAPRSSFLGIQAELPDLFDDDLVAEAIVADTQADADAGGVATQPRRPKPDCDDAPRKKNQTSKKNQGIKRRRTTQLVNECCKHHAITKPDDAPGWAEGDRVQAIIRKLDDVVRENKRLMTALAEAEYQAMLDKADVSRPDDIAAITEAVNAQDAAGPSILG